jgi:uncharacterized protein (DUF1778 family)
MKIELDENQWEWILNLIKNPPKPSQRLIEAMKRHGNDERRVQEFHRERKPF